MPGGKLFLGAGGKAHLCANGKFDIGEACCGTTYKLTPCTLPSLISCRPCSGESGVVGLKLELSGNSEFSDGISFYLQYEYSLFGGCNLQNVPQEYEAPELVAWIRIRSGGLSVYVRQINITPDPDIAYFTGSISLSSISCTTPWSATITNNETAGGEAILTPIYSSSSRCPGGGAIYTNSDLSFYVGKYIVLNDGVCYEVSIDGTESDGIVVVVDSYNTCYECCGDL